MIGFKKKEENIEENSVVSNENIENKPMSFFGKLKAFFFVWNIFSLAVYTTYTMYNLYQKTTSQTLANIVIGLLIGYAVTFICLIAFGIRNKIRLKANLKNYKGSLGILKKLVKVLNLSLSITTAYAALQAGGYLNIFNIIIATLSIIIAFMSISFEIFKMILRTKLAKVKEKKAQKKLNKQN